MEHEQREHCKRFSNSIKQLKDFLSKFDHNDRLHLNQSTQKLLNNAVSTEAHFIFDLQVPNNKEKGPEENREEVEASPLLSELSEGNDSPSAMMLRQR